MPDPISLARERAVRAAYGVEHQLYQLETRTVAQIKAELEVARRSVIATIATAQKDWQIYQAQSLLVEIERQLRAWSVIASSIATGQLHTVSDLGAEQVMAALKSGVGVNIGPTPMISRDFVAVAYQTMPWMISNVGDEIIKRVGSVLQQAVLAQQTPLDAMHTIGTLTGKGAFATPFLRGEAIVRTEYGRIASTANYSTLSGLAQGQKGLQKEWSAVIDARTRPDHAAADGELRDIDETFDIGGEAALYPHDPRLSADQTINCRCISVPYNAAWGDQKVAKATPTPEAPAAAGPPVVKLGDPFPTKSPNPDTGYAEPVSRVTLKSGTEAKISSYGDAVPGGYNGGFAAYDAATGAKMGYMEYQTATGDPSVLIAMNEVDPAYRGKGVSDALLMRLTAEFPGKSIDPGMMTDSGSSWWDRVKGYVPH